MATETTKVADGVDTHAADAAHGGADAVGMPQLDVSTFANQVFWLCVALVVTYLILSRVALPRIAAVLAERQGTITNDIAAAEELKKAAADAEAAYDKALADARAEAARIADETKAEMKRVLEDIQAGRFVQRFMMDNMVGNPEMKASRSRQEAHPIEEVGTRLRAMMPWIGDNKLVDKAKN